MNNKNKLRNLIQRRIVFSLLLGCLFSLQANKALASHASGLDMFYRWVSDSTYEFTLVFYRNCLGTTSGPPNPSATIFAKSASLGLSNIAIVCPMLPPDPNIPLQPANLYNCTESNLCYEEYVYRGTWTSRGRAQDWIFHYQICCRPGGVALPENLNPGTQYIECGLNNLDFPDVKNQNWSPLWHNRRPNHPGYTTDTITNYLMRTVCMGSYYTFDLSVREYQGDSVSYGFYWPQGAGGLPETPKAPFCFDNSCPDGPLPSIPPPININPVTGIIPFTPGAPTGTGVYVIGIEATEWRYDTIVSGGAFAVIPKKIGYIRRDMTIFIDDTLTCHRDSAHPKDVNISSGGGDTIIDIYFHTGNSGDPNSLVRCETLSPDGSEFRLIDSTGYIPGFDTTVRNIGINRAVWECNKGGGILTDKVTLHLAEKLRCQTYYIMLKTGSDLDVIESECGFLEPEFSYGKLIVSKNVKVTLDTIPNVLSLCLPTTNPFPKLTASSTDSSSFPLNYFWAHNGDTVPGQNVPFIWADEPGEYRVMVRDPLNCAGFDKLLVYFDTIPSFNFQLDPYCHKFGEPFDLPDVIAAPNVPGVKKWEWRTSLGLMGEGDTLRTPQLLKNMTYTLKGIKDPIAPGAKPCNFEYTFTYDSASFPPQAPLLVDFLEDELALCLTDDDTGRLAVWEGGLRDKYAPLSIQWYYQNLPITGNKYSREVKDTGRYQVHIEDSLGCWGRDTSIVYHDARLPGPFVPCEVTGAQGTFKFEWDDDYSNRIEDVVVSLDGGNTWFYASNGFEHVVANIQQQRGILARGVVGTACEYTEVSLSEQCPDEVFPPNVITPNGDGVNDYFDIRGLELFFNNKCELEIFDRWGNRVYESNDYRNNWGGGDSPEGTYYYILRVKDGANTVHRGVITVLR